MAMPILVRIKIKVATMAVSRVTGGLEVLVVNLAVDIALALLDPRSTIRES